MKRLRWITYPYREDKSGQKVSICELSSLSRVDLLTVLSYLGPIVQLLLVLSEAFYLALKLSLRRPRLFGALVASVFGVCGKGQQAPEALEFLRVSSSDFLSE